MIAAALALIGTPCLGDAGTQFLAPVQPGTFSDWIDNTCYYSLMQLGYVKVTDLPGQTSASPVSATVDRLANDLAYQITGHSRERFIPSLRVSPNNTWVLAALCNSPVGVSSIHVKSANGQYESYKTDNNDSYPIWSPDSKHVVEMNFDSHGSSVNWYTPGAKTKCIEIRDLRIRYSDSKGFDSELLGISARGSGVVVRWLRRSTSPVEIYDVDIESGKRKTRKIVLRTPKGRRTDELCYSYMNDKLAMLCYRGPARQVSESPSVKSAAIEIWTCSTDGSQMNLVLTVAIDGQDADKWATRHGPTQLTWMPDGDHLSYIMDDGLWKLAVK